jgi:hypothetical protein
VFGTAWVVHGKVDAVDQTKGETVKLLTDRQLRRAKEAVAIAELAIELRPTPAQPISDHAAMKALLSEIAESELEVEYYLIAARLAISGKSEQMARSADALRSRIAGCGSPQTRVERRRLCAAVELPNRDAELLGLVGEV